ncbi:MAG TPA: S4 domain-containing protein, partial [Alphaproteobacteria bacterium]|nr:S4 domain-containing protein [Alphaproteobacteria bacterium]
MPHPLHLTATAGRLDKVLSSLAPQLSRARLQALIKAGQLRVDGKTVTAPAHKLKGFEALELRVPAPAPAKPRAR